MIISSGQLSVTRLIYDIPFICLCQPFKNNILNNLFIIIHSLIILPVFAFLYRLRRLGHGRFELSRKRIVPSELSCLALSLSFRSPTTAPKNQLFI